MKYHLLNELCFICVSHKKEIYKFMTVVDYIIDKDE